MPSSGGALPADFLRGFPTLLRQILWKRGFRDSKSAEAFLSPSLSQVPSPFDSLLDLNLAVSALLGARDRKEHVVIFGDYDVDGATSTTLLTQTLRDWGWNVSYFVPHRVKQGYGVTRDAAEVLLAKKPDVKLVVTCDCGISSFEGIEFLKSKSVDVIVTDHHEVPKDRVPAIAVLNPKQSKCGYPEKRLAGVGVAFLLVIALRRALDFKDYALSPLLDLVAVGTVCDVAELQGANRVFVKLGLEKLRESSRAGFRVMLDQLDLRDKALKTKDLGFMIGPRINATGRIGEPDVGVRTLMAKDQNEARELFQILESHNRKRRDMQEIQLKEAEQMAEERLQREPDRMTLTLFDPNFHLGIVGLLASRLVEKFGRPTCVVTRLVDEHALADFAPENILGETSLLKGSLRTPPGFHLADALQAIRSMAPELLKSGGGHAMAAGVAFREKDFKLFESSFELAIKNQGITERVIDVDAELESVDGIMEVLSLLEPIGQGNPAPLLRVKGYRPSKVTIMKEEHLKIHGRVKGSNFSVLQFRSPWVRLMANLVGGGPTLGDAVDLDFIAELTENEWNGNKSVEFYLKDLLEVKKNGERVETRNRTDEVSQSKAVRQTSRNSDTHPA